MGEYGYYRDGATLQYVRARWLAVGTGRWLSEDPLRCDAGDYNLYRYVGNEPVARQDASGLVAKCHGDASHIGRLCRQIDKAYKHFTCMSFWSCPDNCWLSCRYANAKSLPCCTSRNHNCCCPPVVAHEHNVFASRRVNRGRPCGSRLHIYSLSLKKGADFTAVDNGPSTRLHGRDLDIYIGGIFGAPAQRVMWVCYKESLKTKDPRIIPCASQHTFPSECGC